MSDRDTIWLIAIIIAATVAAALWSFAWLCDTLRKFIENEDKRRSKTK